MPRLCFIFNPCAGFNRHRPEGLVRLRAWVAAQRGDAECVPTERPRHATELAQAALARGCERIVAVGGDGTLNEVARALVGTPAAFGLIPCGSGNGLGRHLGIHGGLERALSIVATGRIRTIDTGEADGQPFFNVMGLGFDAAIAQHFNALARRGFVSYLRTGWRTFFDYRPETYTLREADGWSATLPAFMVAVANSDQYGNNARIAPGARVDDGRLDLVAVPPVGLLSAPGMVLRFFTRRLTQHPRVVHHPGRQFTIIRSRPGPMHLDGEIRETGIEVVVRVRPQSLRVLVPAD